LQYANTEGKGLGDFDVISHDQLFLRISMLQVIKDLRWEWRGNEAAGWRTCGLCDNSSSLSLSLLGELQTTHQKRKGFFARADEDAFPCSYNQPPGTGLNVQLVFMLLFFFHKTNTFSLWILEGIFFSS